MKYLKEVLLLLILFTFPSLSAQFFGTKVAPHYVFPEFEDGVVKLTTGQVTEAKLNYNMITEEILFDNNGNILALAGNTLANLDSVIILDRKFIREGGKYYEVLFDEAFTILIFYGIQVTSAGKEGAYGVKSKVAAIDKYNRFIGSDGNMYASELSEEYELSKKYVYILRKGGEDKKFNSLSHIRKSYKEQKLKYKTFSKKHKPKYENPFEISALIQFLEE